ncbi:MICAL-like protein 2 isoform 2-T2 [Polymixia lowei]
MSAVKALQQWCKIQCNGYRDVSITNMTTSFRDGLAFCALIHKHRPDLINFDSLKKNDVYDNNKLAFNVAEEELGIPALLDAEDMVALKVPDRLSILTYVSQYYNYFHGRSPIGGLAGVKRPAEGCQDGPSGKKNQPVVSKVFPPSKPSPPPSSIIINPSSSPGRPSPTPTRHATQEALVENSQRTGTLSNKCVSCHKHVHLVQRHLVEGKLYHRNCAKALSSSNTNTPLRDLPKNVVPAVSKYVPHSDPIKADVTPAPVPSKLGPSWLTSKTVQSSPPATTSTTSTSTSSPQRPAWGLSSSSGRGNQTAVDPAPTATATTRPSAAPPSASNPTFTTTTIVTRPVAAPRASVTASKTQQAKLKFFQKGPDAAEEEKKTPAKNVNTRGGLTVDSRGQGATVGQSVSVVVSVAGAGGKDARVSVSGSAGGDRAKAAGVGGGSGKVWPKEENVSSSKTQAAAAFISKKLTEENNNNNSKPAWTAVALKKTDKSQVEPSKKETGGVRGRVKLKADPSLLADLQTPSITTTPAPASRSGLPDRTPDKRSPKPASAASSNTIALENSDSPAEWRLRLKPVSKDTSPAGPKQSSPLPSHSKPADGPSKPWPAGAGKSHVADPPLHPSSSHPPGPSAPTTRPATKGFLNGESSLTANGTKPEPKSSKTKPGYIPKEKIMEELQEIEDSLNDLEKRGVDLETRLRRSEEEGEEDSLADELMIEWFNLIRNKQVAIRRESELVYIARTQDLEEQQPSVEQELRCLMEKPDRLKTSWDRKREEELMAKLVEIVNDRNAIVDGLDEDRLREEEEDEQLNKMMMNFDIKKDKPKKKSPMSKLFSWGNKKEG